jgi:type I restriction enzyme S subunit
MSSKKKTTGTKEDGKPALVPKLRFPEFRGAEGWKPSVLEAACDMQAGKFVAAASISERKEERLFPCYGGNGLRGFTATYTHDGMYPLIGRQGALCGNVRLVGGRFHATEHAVVVTPKEAIDVVWLYYSLDLLNLNRFATGQAQPGLSVDVLENVALAIPDKTAEQQKIAECLNSVDVAIAEQARKVDALKTHRKALMQQLFPREGETQPRLRFPEFQNDGEWKKKTLGRLADFQSGGTPSKANAAFWNGSVPWVSAKDMKQLFLEDAEDHISAAAVDDGAKLVPAGTLLMLVRGMTLLKDVPICVLCQKMSFNQDVKALRPKEDVDGLYLALLLTGSKDRLLEMVTVAGHGTGKLDTDELKAMELMLPRPAEQKHIASCLSNLDTLITAETQQLEAMKRHKRGLMQQLFPSPEEVEA